MGSYISRSQSGLRGSTDGLFVDPSEKSRFVVHWDGGRNPVDAEDELALLRAYIQHHFSQGWQGPAYNLGVGPITGNVYELRGLGAVGTHAPGANRNGIGVILIGGPGNLTEAGKQGLRDAYALACRFAGRELTQEVHSDVVATECPGDQIRGWVHGGGLAGGNVPSTGGTPATPVGAFPARERYGSEWVRLLQLDLIAIGHDLGPDGADGFDGDRTQAVVEFEQKMGGITVDRIGGPELRRYIDRYMARIGKVPAFPLPAGWYFGPEDGPQESVSGYHGNGEHLERFQQRLKDRGWDILVDGRWGDDSTENTKAFQAEKGLTADGLAGIDTWTQAWLAPVTPA